MDYSVGDIVWLEMDKNYLLYSGPAKILEASKQFDWKVKIPVNVVVNTLGTSIHTQSLYIHNHEIKHKMVLQ